MFEPIRIKSSFRDYFVNWVKDFSPSLEAEFKKDGFLIVDSNVFEIYKERIQKNLVEGKFLIVEANERNKSFDKSKEIMEALIERKVRRNHRLIALGGGIIQDLTAFSASILYRGIDWVFFPTTLLAQGDSCIGSKTSINLGDNKNLIGNFYPPSEIFIDTAFLHSLPVDDVKSGIGEILHFYFFSNSPLTEKLLGNYDNLIVDRNLLSEYIRESLKIKKSVIETDEFDKNERNKFNYGHTFGHAIETVTNYEIKHGLAVTIGMDLANFLSFHYGLMSQGQYESMKSKLKINFPSYDWRMIDLESLVNALSKDKKNVGANLCCILSEGPGRLSKREILFDDFLKEKIKSYFDNLV